MRRKTKEMCHTPSHGLGSIQSWSRRCWDLRLCLLEFESYPGGMPQAGAASARPPDLIHAQDDLTVRYQMGLQGKGNSATCSGAISYRAYYPDTLFLSTYRVIGSEKNHHASPRSRVDLNLNLRGPHHIGVTGEQGNTVSTDLLPLYIYIYYY